MAEIMANQWVSARRAEKRGRHVDLIDLPREQEGRRWRPQRSSRCWLVRRRKRKL